MCFGRHWLCLPQSPAQPLTRFPGSIHACCVHEHSTKFQDSLPEVTRSPWTARLPFIVFITCTGFDSILKCIFKEEINEGIWSDGLSMWAPMFSNTDHHGNMVAFTFHQLRRWTLLPTDAKPIGYSFTQCSLQRSLPERQWTSLPETFPWSGVNR